jgi:hypothetical protein
MPATDLAAESRVGVNPQVPGAEAIVEVGDSDERFGGSSLVCSKVVWGGSGLVCGKELRRYDDNHPEFGTLDEWHCDVCGRDFGAWSATAS